MKLDVFADIIMTAAITCCSFQEFSMFVSISETVRLWTEFS